MLLVPKSINNRHHKRLDADRSISQQSKPEIVEFCSDDSGSLLNLSMPQEETIIKKLPYKSSSFMACSHVRDSFRQC